MKDYAVDRYDARMKEGKGRETGVQQEYRYRRVMLICERGANGNE